MCRARDLLKNESAHSLTLLSFITFSQSTNNQERTCEILDSLAPCDLEHLFKRNHLKTSLMNTAGNSSQVASHSFTVRGQTQRRWESLV